MLRQNRLLVIVAHPDDEVLGCGATVRRMVDEGWQADLVILTGGVTGRFSDTTSTEAEVVAEQEALASETRIAADLLGFEEVYRFDFPDNRMDTVGRMDIVHAIQPIITDICPDLVMTHHPGDYNWDHTIAFDSVLMAARCNPPDHTPDEIRTFEVLSSTERGQIDSARVFVPNIYVNIVDTIETKKQAMKSYVSEYREYPHPRSEEAIEYLARKRGKRSRLHPRRGLSSDQAAWGRLSALMSDAITFEECRPVEAHCRLIMQWRNDPVSLSMFYHQEPKVWESFWPEYRDTYFGTPGTPSPVFGIDQAERVSFLRFQLIANPEELDGRVVDISINVRPDGRGRGIGTRSLRALLPYLRGQKIDGVYAEVKSENIASQCMFTAAGFEHVAPRSKHVLDIDQTFFVERYIADLSAAPCNPHQIDEA